RRKDHARSGDPRRRAGLRARRERRHFLPRGVSARREAAEKVKPAAESHTAPRAASLCLATCGVLAAASAIVIAGCGQKGPLYLPQHTGTVITRPTPAAASSQSSSSSSSSSSAPAGK